MEDFLADINLHLTIEPSLAHVCFVAETKKGFHRMNSENTLYSPNIACGLVNDRFKFTIG